MKRPPVVAIGYPDAVHLERFAAKVAEAPSGCHIWLGVLNSGGYGAFRLDGRQVYAHRVAWVIANGAIDGALTIDHLCRVRRCVNPAHLDLVTSAVNTARQSRGFADRLNCPAGHPYAGANLYRFPDGRRACRACQRAAQARYQERKKASA